MGNRSNINLVGNTTQGQNVGIGTDVFKGKSVGNILQYKTLSVTGSTMTITCDDDNIYFSAATGSGGGLSSSSNGLNDNGSVVKLGGDLTETTTISGGSFTHDMCFHQLSNFNICNLGGNVNMNANGGKINLEGCDNNCIVVGLGIQLCQGGSSFIQMKNLSAQSSETDVLYINAGGCLFSGASGGGTAVGWSCLTNFGTSVGCGAMTYIAGATNNTVVGVNALASASLTGDANTAVGVGALKVNTTGCENIAIGCDALVANTTGRDNVVVGDGVMPSAINALNNVVIGHYGLWSANQACCNIAIGDNVGTYFVSGFSNIFIGPSVGASATCGDYNVAIGGDLTLNAVSGGKRNFAMGICAGSSIEKGCDNHAYGTESLYNATDGNNNLALGTSSLFSVWTGNNNIGLGFCAGNSSCLSDDNIYVGTCSGEGHTGERSVFIGRYAGSGVTTTSDVLRIGNKKSGDLICGDFATDKVTVCCLQITAGAANGCVLTSDVSGNASWSTGGGTEAFAALTSNSSVSWDTSGGLNKTWSINSSYTLTLTNVASGMYGTARVTITAGTPTITLAGSGLSFRGNGSLASLANGTYMLAWVATSSTTVEWNIALYA